MLLRFTLFLSSSLFFWEGGPRKKRGPCPTWEMVGRLHPFESSISRPISRSPQAPLMCLDFEPSICGRRSPWAFNLHLCFASFVCVILPASSSGQLSVFCIRTEPICQNPFTGSPSLWLTGCCFLWGSSHGKTLKYSLVVWKFGI